MAQIGQLVQCDDATSKRDKVQFARVMVRVRVNQHLPNSLTFLDENGVKQECSVTYKWKPQQCGNCMRFGLELVDCRAHKHNKIWVLKKSTVSTSNVAPAPTIEEKNVVDVEGFQKALKQIKLKPTSVPSTSTTNAFDILMNVVEEIQDVVQTKVKQIVFGEHAVSHGHCCGRRELLHKQWIESSAGMSEGSTTQRSSLML